MGIGREHQIRPKVLGIVPVGRAGTRRPHTFEHYSNMQAAFQGESERYCLRMAAVRDQASWAAVAS